MKNFDSRSRMTAGQNIMTEAFNITTPGHFIVQHQDLPECKIMAPVVNFLTRDRNIMTGGILCVGVKMFYYIGKSKIFWGCTAL